MYRLLARIGAFALVALLFGGVNVARADEAPPPTGFTVVPGDALVLSQPTSAGPATGTITVGNGTNQPIEVRVTAVLRDADSKKVTPAPLVEPKTLLVGDVEEFEISAAGVEEGTVLVTAIGVSDNAQVAVVELPVSTVTKDDPKTPQPAVSEWKVTRGTWGTGKAVETMNIPQKATCSPKWKAQDLVLAGSSGSVPTQVTCNSDGQLEVSYASDGIMPGVYTGTIKFGDDALAITLTQQRPFWMALILPSLGVLVVWAATAFWTVVRPLQKIGKGLTAAEQAVKDAARAIPITVETDFAAETKLVASYRKPRFFWPLVTVLTPAATTELEKALATREEDAGLLPKLQEARDMLEDKRSWLADGTPLRKRADAYFAETPGWRYRGAETIAKIAALAQIATLREDLRDVKDTAVSLGACLLRPTERTELRAVRAEIERLSALVDDSDDAAAVLTGGLVESVRAVRANCTALYASVHAGTSPGTGTSATLEATGLPPLTQVPSPAGLPIPDLRPILDSLARVAATAAGVAAPWILYLVTAAIAFYAGLEAFYFDKPWGTGRDYVAAFIYGATVLAVSLSLGTFFSKRGQKEG